MSNTVAGRPVDVNQAFAAERRTQIQTARDAEQARIDAAAKRAVAFDRRIADGRLVPLGGGQFRVNEPGNWDNGEILTRQVEQTTGRVLLLPQHGLDEVDGRISLYTSTPAWHELGQVIDGGTSDVDEVLKLGGLDYDVVKEPVRFQREDGSLATMLGQFVTVRTDTEDGLGVVGARYEVLQNREAFTFLQDLVDKYDVRWESAGTLRGGRRVFVSLRLPETVTIDADGIRDEILPFIVAMNSHDASSPFYVVATPWRPVCRNTERFAMRDATARWSTRHTSGARERFEEARRTLGLSVKYFEQFAREEEALARTELELAEFHKLVDHLWTPPEEDASERSLANHAARVEAITELWAENTNRLGKTAYAAERTVTEWLDWRKTVRPGESLRGNNLAVRATAMLEGSDDETKSKAHRQLLTLVRGAR